METTPVQANFDLGEPRRWQQADGGGGRAVWYFAILPGAALASRAAALAEALNEEHHFASSPYPIERMHLSLCRIGSYANSDAEIEAAAAKVAARIAMPAFNLMLDSVLSFQTGSRHVVLAGGDGCQQFQMLQRRLQNELRSMGFHVDAPSPLPHMTLFYKGHEITPTPLLSPLLLAAREFVLVKSHIGQARHEHAGRWPLLTQTH